MQFTLLSWNIWYDNQINGAVRSDKLLAELARIIDTYNPDCICLNEVARKLHAKHPAVHAFLAKQGYTHHFYAQASPLNNEWAVGAGMCSRIPFTTIESFELGRDVSAARRGYVGETVKGITATISLDDQEPLHIILAHPHHLRTWTIRDHYKHTATLTSMIRETRFQKNTIICGDFNEPGFMPRSFAKANHAILHYRTGHRIHTTWRLLALRFVPIRANLDKLFWTRTSNLHLKHFQVIRTNISDHRPLLATFQIKTGKRLRHTHRKSHPQG